MVVRILILFQTFLAFKTTTEVLGANHRCYVCIPNTGSSISDVLQMFPETTDIPLCSQFQINKPEYVRECPPPNYQGCLTQTNGTHVTKTCTEVGIEDCKTANKIKYCYCKDDLCNGEPVPAETPLPEDIPEQEEEEEEEDDEDSPSEGSGSPEGSDSKQMEVSSEGVDAANDLGIEVIEKQIPTTTKSVILTTLRPAGGQTVKSSAVHSSQPLNAINVISFLLLIFRFTLHQ